MDTGRTVWELAELHAPGIPLELIEGVVRVFIHQDPWADDERQCERYGPWINNVNRWSWFLADHQLDLSPYYWGVQA